MGTFVMIFASFFYTFPRIDQMVHAYPHSHKVFQVLLQIFLPPVVIGLQVVVLFIPVAVYTWLWGKLEIAKIKP